MFASTNIASRDISDARKGEDGEEGGLDLAGEGKDGDELQCLSLSSVFPDKSRESAKPVFEFIKWLKDKRKISVSYEANVLRGLTKLIKFRFAKGG